MNEPTGSFAMPECNQLNSNCQALVGRIRLSPSPQMTDMARRLVCRGVSGSGCRGRKYGGTAHGGRCRKGTQYRPEFG
jgi:hypothetical protein